MREYLEIGPTPSDEPCESLGPNYDPEKAREECRRFITLLEQKFPGAPDGCAFVIRSNPHDFGTYLEVAVRYDDEDEAQVDYALCVEHNTPANWDDVDVIDWREWQRIE